MAHPLVSKDSFEILAALLVHVKRNKHGDSAYSLAEARWELHDTLEALRLAGYHVVPKGVLDSIRRTLGNLPE